jgi:hypothetical protein
MLTVLMAEGEIARDMAYAYVQSIHHLRDWLRNDPESGISLSVINAFVRQTKRLQMVADLCYGSKHARLTRDRWYEEGEVEITAFGASDGRSVTKWLFALKWGAPGS